MIVEIHTQLLAGLANGHIIVICNNAHLVHQSDLLGIVATQSLGGGVDVWEESENILRRDRLGFGDGSG